jgi:Family of unknown function (DUF6152)
MRPTRSLHVLLVASTASLVTLSAPAHHSYAQFDRCHPVALEGDIQNVEWANPHIVISLKTADATSYRLEWFNLPQLQSAGLSTGTLKTGDHVVITGSATRDPALRLVSLLTEIRRPSDGWSWTRPPRPESLDCEAQAASAAKPPV